MQYIHIELAEFNSSSGNDVHGCMATHHAGDHTEFPVPVQRRVLPIELWGSILRVLMYILQKLFFLRQHLVSDFSRVYVWGWAKQIGNNTNETWPRMFSLSSFMTLSYMV